MKTEEFLQMVDGLKATGKTTLLTSHDPLVYESSIVDRVVSIQDGLLES